MTSSMDPVSPREVDPGYETFLDLFNAGDFWESHEALEGPWRETGSVFYHALILFASAFVHVERGNRHGIVAQLGKAQPLFESHRPHYLGLDVDGILEHTAVCRHLVAENPQAPGDAWGLLIPRPKLRFSAERVRGDETELAPEEADRGPSDPESSDPGSPDPGSPDPGSSDPGSSDPGSPDPGSADAAS